MKIRAFVVSTLIACGILSAIFYVKADRVSADEKTIMEAIQAKDTPTLIRSLISRMKSQLEKDTDTFPELIGEVEKYAAASDDSVSVAVLHSMIAEMYQSYYTANRWNISSRTELRGYVPDDIREWTSKLFTEKIEQELSLSLQPAGALQQTPASRYDLILKKGKDTPSLRPTLYDFLAFRAIDIQPASQWYEELIAFRRTQPEKKALLMDELEYWQYKHNNRSTTSADYRNALDSLYRIYEKEPFAAEIRIAEMNLLVQESYRSPEAQQDSAKAALYALCRENIAEYGSYERVNAFKNQLNSMETPVLHIRSSNNVYPGKNLTMQIRYVNTPRLTVRIYKSLRRPENAWYNFKGNPVKRGERVKEITFDMHLANSYTEADSTLAIPMDKPGLYEYEVTAEGKRLSVSNCFSVSRLAAVIRNQADRSEVLVADMESGKPVEGATVICYRTDMMEGSLQQQGEVKTDGSGIAILPKGKKIEQIRPVFKEDTASLITNVYTRYGTSFSGKEEGKIDLAMFTDRKIYRPGQNVFFKGLVYVSDTDHPHVVAGRAYTVALRDANDKEVASKTFKTDKFGSFNGEFTIPAQTLSGSFTLVSERTRTEIRVEEYKRPTFQVNFLPLKEEVSFGKPVKLTGEAQTFSGISLQEGEIRYTIVRRPFWARSYMSDPFDFTYKQVGNGTTEIDKKGNFTVSFTPERPEKAGTCSVFQSYEVTATLTDSKGETQEASYTFSVGDTGILLDIRMTGEQMERDSAKAVITAYTANGQKVSAKGTYTIYSLTDQKEKNEPFGTDRYEVGKPMTSGDFTTEDALSPDVFRGLPSGRYRLEVKSADSDGKAVSAEYDFVLYSRDDKRPPVFTHTWLLNLQTTCSPGEEAEFIFGTSDKDTYVLYEKYTDTQKCAERKYIRMSNENRTFRIPFKETDGKGFTVSFTFIKDGELYTRDVAVYRRQPNRKLSIRTETFRDHLLPGSKENWKFRITDADSAAVSAEVLAGMYDASLDKLIPFSWSFSPFSIPYLYVPGFSKGSAFNSSSRYETGGRKELNVPQYEYDRLDWQDMLSLGYRFYGQSNQVFLRGGVMKSAVPTATVAEMAVSNTSFLEESAVMDGGGNAGDRDEMATDGPGVEGRRIQESAQLRENFAETAFFYPALVTDKAGEVAFGFTMPESNTTWKLQLLAQTEDLKYGYLSKEVVTSKPLMVTPNLPRFLRQGDEVTFTAQVSNQSDAAINGETRLELFDPESNRPVTSPTGLQRSFTLGADSTATVSWSFKVPAAVGNLIGCRIIAESDKGSDGEQHLLPVLSNEILVTESTPFFLFDKKETTVRLKDDKGIRPFRTTLELTANPVWYAVQALPTLSQPENDDIISWFASYYSNTLASHIAASHPRIRQMISRWKAQGGDASTLYSNLQQNEELKNILLQETPWVLEAGNETEQKQRLSLLFDMNRAAGQRETALRRLLDMQAESGGWSWFKGMYPSQEITLYILKGMSQLTEMNAVEYSEEEKEMQIKALQFVDKEIQADYEALRKMRNWQRNEISPLEIEYLFVRSCYRDIPELGSAREAIRYYTDLAEKQWNKQSIYGRGVIARLMLRNGKKEIAGEILSWLRKTASVSPDKGMYWANNRRGSGFFVSPIETHCLLMALFHEVAPDTQEADRMKQWLLSQKRTQDWESVPATTHAIYALLLTGSDWLADNNTCTAEWDGQTYSTANGESGSGYLKEILSNGKPVAGSNSVSIRKEGTAPAWGAVYEQYYQNINEVKKQKGVLNVEKKLFVETNDGTGRQLRPVTPEETLRVGDKVVVRLVVRTDRDMNYVFLKDLRAGCFEPTDPLSGSIYRDGAWYYRTPTDVSENFFFDRLPGGTYVVEYAVYVSRPGRYAGGISTIQCLYAPEFVSHTEGGKIAVSDF